MTSKTIPFKTPTARSAEEWVQPRTDAEAPKPASAGPTKRLTVDIAADLHRRIKLDSVRRDLDISEIVRDLLAKTYPATPSAE